MWQFYLRQCHGIVFVVDAADARRMPTAFAELCLLLRNDALTRRRPRLPLLLFANKSDRPTFAADDFRRFANAITVRCRESGRPCYVVAGCALTGTGLRNGFTSLLEQIAVARAAGAAWRCDRRPTWYQPPYSLVERRDVMRKKCRRKNTRLHCPRTV